MIISFSFLQNLVSVYLLTGFFTLLFVVFDGDVNWSKNLTWKVLEVVFTLVAWPLTLYFYKNERS
jgi:hypothetical protein